MPRYRNKVNRVVVSLADGHSVDLGSDWEVLGVEPAPEARTPDDELPEAEPEADAPAEDEQPPSKAKPARGK